MSTPLGRVTRNYTCGVCKSPLTDGWDCVSSGGKNVLTATCPLGHQLRTEWPVGQQMPDDAAVKTEFGVDGGHP